MAQDIQRSETRRLFGELEAEHDEVHAFVTGRLKLASLPGEPDWVREAMARSWPRVLAEADAASW